MNYRRLLLWLLLALGCNVHADTETAELAQKTIYQFGVFAYRGVERTREEFVPVIEALNHSLKNEHLALNVLSQAEIYQGLENKTLDFVTTNPTHFLVARQHFQVTGALATLVKSDQGKPVSSLAGTIIVRSDNPNINSIADLSGKIIVSPGPEYMGGYRAQAYELYLAGINPKTQRMQFVGSHFASVEAVINREADAGFIRDGILESMTQNGLLDPSQLKVINAQYRPDFSHAISTRLYPEWPVFALPHVSDQAKRSITAALLNLEFHEINLPDSTIYGFNVPADYLGVESLSRALRIPPFELREAITLDDLKALHGAAIGWIIAFAFALFISLIFLIITAKKYRASSLYNQQLLASQSELVLVNNGDELIDVSGGFLRFFSGHYRSLAAFKQDYRCISDLFIKRKGYLFNTHAMEWLDTIVAKPTQQHKALVNFQGQHTYFKCSAVYSKPLGLYLISMVDISELETTNQRLIQQTQITEQAHQTKSNFLASIGYEIRTPINSILELSELGQTEQAPDKLHQCLQKIHHSGTQLLHIINTILDLSRIKAGRLSIDAQPFNLSQMLHGLHEHYHPQAKQKNIEFKYNLDPQLATDYKGDEMRLHQVLNNLIGNAIKFTEQGSVTLRVKLEQPLKKQPESNQDWLYFEVQDTGKGISLEQQQRLFKPFSQADDAIARQYGGAGLGLNISDELIQLMGGEHIRVQSEIGQGSAFSFSLPLEQTQLPDA